ncbi:MAG: LPS assembly protein LptD [Verrucomicrobiota bacterium]|nr:LPS assembly protein LptD [Verrucomicrobiota bacterium]
MRKWLPIAVALPWLYTADAATPFADMATPATLEVENLTAESEVEYFEENSRWVGRKGVLVRYGDARLTADEVILDEKTMDVIATGNVTLHRGAEYWRGTKLRYNFSSNQSDGAEFRAGFAPVFVQGMTLRADSGNSTNQVYEIGDAFVTTDDLENPTFRIKAKKIRVKVGDEVEAEDATLYVGNMPIFYFPYYQRTLKKHQNYLSLTPGYRSLYGPYLLSSYHWHWNTNLMTAAHLDLYGKRGVGLGPEIQYNFKGLGHGELQGYYIDDKRPGNDPLGQPIEDDRHRIRFSHQATLDTNFTAKLVIRQQSDPFVIRDFFENEYRTNAQPKSFLEVNRFWSNFNLNILAQAQVNDFYQTIERLPDVKLSGLRQQIGDSPLFYESESSVAYLRFQSGIPTGTNYAAGRADTYHQLLLPQNYFGWLNFTPRIGGRLSSYSETEGVHSVLNEQHRAVFNTGAELSFKASQVWAGARNRLLDITGIRHLIEPSINYVFVPSPNKLPRELPQFDTEIPSLRLLPIEYPDYNAIDSIDSQNVLRLGLRNKIQTKRDGKIDNVANWALYTDWRLNPRAGQGTFADLFSDLDFRPRDWLTLNSETRYDVEDGEWVTANHTLTLTPNTTWSWRLGHWYFRGDPFYGPDSDNNTLYHSLYYRLNENWGTRISHHFEARDGTLEEQYYTLYRDFRSWTGALTFRVRDNRSGPTDFTVALTFSLKATPSRSVGSDRNQPSLLLGN